MRTSILFVEGAPYISNHPLKAEEFDFLTQNKERGVLE